MRPCAQPFRCAPQRRSGWTLVELLLVLSILALIAAMARGTISGAFSAQTLRTAADRVQTALNRARHAAMANGATYVFHYSEGDDSAKVARWEQSDRGKPNDEENADADSDDSFSIELPGDVTFGAGDVLHNRAAPATPGFGTSASDQGPADDSGAIYFYADGASTSARIVLVNERGHRVVVALRGLTGTSLVMDGGSE